MHPLIQNAIREYFKRSVDLDLLGVQKVAQETLLKLSENGPLSLIQHFETLSSHLYQKYLDNAATVDLYFQMGMIAFDHRLYPDSLTFFTNCQNRLNDQVDIKCCTSILRVHIQKGLVFQELNKIDDAILQFEWVREYVFQNYTEKLFLHYLPILERLQKLYFKCENVDVAARKLKDTLDVCAANTDARPRLFYVKVLIESSVFNIEHQHLTDALETIAQAGKILEAFNDSAFLEEKINSLMKLAELCQRIGNTVDAQSFYQHIVNTIPSDLQNNYQYYMAKAVEKLEATKPLKDDSDNKDQRTASNRGSQPEDYSQASSLNKELGPDESESVMIPLPGQFPENQELKVVSEHRPWLMSKSRVLLLIIMLIFVISYLI
ncbi:uncharacterized protein BJ171DRAFT_247948 [Polychytrium aggregatum]|uniref:uncharacterized protein n=1 Tax=Polychytrium aggregatum TaxID=110093 RepID=UPI0022FDE8B3|nr:uncharacterized protein BJ171DRAFT_247948 [Polychytrium aggregatum]KAI9193666.1 hypothetical protein BJ171DRAFT_247948 [Polychytrium aggregatum]